MCYASYLIRLMDSWKACRRPVNLLACRQPVFCREKFKFLWKWATKLELQNGHLFLSNFEFYQFLFIFHNQSQVFTIIGQKYDRQDWVAFMSQPYWVEVKVEVELTLILRLICGRGWCEIEMILSRSLVEIELRLCWVGVEISWH